MEQARTVDVEAAFTDPKDFQSLLPGYSADVEIILQVREDVVRVPTEAIIEGQRVFVYLSGTGKLVRRNIHTGLSNWDWTEVTEGLQPDDHVVVNVDNPKLADGAAAVLSKDAP